MHSPFSLSRFAASTYPNACALLIPETSYCAGRVFPNRRNRMNSLHAASIYGINTSKNPKWHRGNVDSQRETPNDTPHHEAHYNISNLSCNWRNPLIRKNTPLTAHPILQLFTGGTQYPTRQLPRRVSQAIYTLLMKRPSLHPHTKETQSPTRQLPTVSRIDKNRIAATWMLATKYCVSVLYRRGSSPANLTFFF